MGLYFVILEASAYPVKVYFLEFGISFDLPSEHYEKRPQKPLTMEFGCSVLPKKTLFALVLTYGVRISHPCLFVLTF